LTHIRLHLKNVHGWKIGHNGGRPSKAGWRSTQPSTQHFQYILN
jgi:hypothetical protein